MSDLRRRLARKYPQIEVWAAGGVVLRGVAGRPEVLLAHRPHRKDWSFPKGKLDPGETLGRAAERSHGDYHAQPFLRQASLEDLASQ